MEGWGQTPSQPSNFVSLLHLRDRWLKEKEVEQKEKEDLKKLELVERQQKVPRTKPAEKDDQKPVVQKPRNNASSWSRNGSGKFQGYYRAVPVSNTRNVNESFKKTVDEGEPELANPQIESNRRNLTETCKKTVPVSNPRNVNETFKKTKDKGGPEPAVPRGESNPRNVTETYKKTVPVSNPRNVNKTSKKTEDEGESEPAVPNLRNVTDICKKTVPVRNPRNVNKTFKKTKDEGEPEPAVPRIESNPRNVTETCKKTVPVSNPRNVNKTFKKTEDEGEPEPAVPNSRNVTNICKKTVSVRNPRNVSETLKKSEDEGEPELAVPRIERDEKKKRKSRRKDGKKKANAQKEEIDKTLPRPEEENVKEEMLKKECGIGVQNGKKKVRARKIDEKKGTESQCGPDETGNTHEMKKIEEKLSLISVSFEIKREGRTNGIYRGSNQGNRNFRDHRDLDRWGSRKQRDVGMIWVRKDELSKGA